MHELAVQCQFYVAFVEFMFSVLVQIEKINETSVTLLVQQLKNPLLDFAWLLVFRNKGEDVKFFLIQSLPSEYLTELLS